MAHRLARWATSEEGSNQRDLESRPARTLTGFMKIWRNAKNTQDSTTKIRIMLMRPFLWSSPALTSPAKEAAPRLGALLRESLFESSTYYDSQNSVQG